MNWPLLTGIAAALCTTLAFVPQLFKIEKQRSTELSSAMLFIYLGGQVLWLTYGVMLRSIPLIAANATSTILVYAVSARRAAAARRMARPAGPLRVAIDLEALLADAPGCADAIREMARRHDIVILSTTAGQTHDAGDTRDLRVDSWKDVRELVARLDHPSPS